MKLQFTGTRTRDFTTDANGHRYYVKPSEPLEVERADGESLLKRDPHLWRRVAERKPVAVATPEPEPPEE